MNHHVKAKHLAEHIARALQDPAACRGVAEIIQGALDEAHEAGMLKANENFGLQMRHQGNPRPITIPPGTFQ